MPRPDLMEAGEANAVVGAILWLAQTILETLQPGKLADWLREVGLAGAIDELKSEVERMETVANGVNGRAVGNKPLARSLARVRELMYEADDVVDELDYFRLQEEVKGVMICPAIGPEGMVGDGAEQVDASANTAVMLASAIGLEGMVGDGAEHVDASTSTAGIPDNNVRKNRSKERDYFDITPAINGQPARAKCIDCGTQVIFSHGTSVLRKHRNSASCKKKRAVIEEAPNCPSAGDSVKNCAITLNNTDSECRKRIRTDSNVATATHCWDKANFLKRIHEIALEFGSIRGYVIEYLKDSVPSSNQYQSNTTSNAQIRTSGSLQGKVYGRDMEKKEIMRLIKTPKSDIITVLPIVGIVGVGKTTLAKFVYNDPTIESQFERIWVWVSNIFDELRVTREILDAITLSRHEGSPSNRESYEGVSNYTKLQEVLKKQMACQTKKFLLVLDDVYDMDGSRWKDLLYALRSSCTKGNVIIVTVRNLSVAQRLGTVTPVKLGALEDDVFWLLFKACAFGGDNCKQHLDIGRQISAKLKGNPLAAKNAAEMLREQPTLEHWKSIMKNGVWESMQLRGGIVTVLKISYYQLPYHLQQCQLFCSIFPNGYLFQTDSLVNMWTSSGFVKSAEAGQGYLNDLVNSGFFEQVIIKDSILCYVVCGIMHEFARLISTEFATIDGLECKEVLPTLRHFSIITDSLYHKDEHGIILRNFKYEEKLQSIVSSTRGLRTLILIGHFDTSFFWSFLAFVYILVNRIHLRYLKLESKGSIEDLPLFLDNFYHLEVVDVEQPVTINDTSDLVNIRNLVLSKLARSACSLEWSACLQTIHLEDCEGWETLPFLERLSFLKKLKLKNMLKVTELLIPSLEELVLIDMPKLDRCLSSSVRDLNSDLTILEIRRCQVLKAFPLFESCEKCEIEQNSWLLHISELTIDDCPYLTISNPLPPSSSFCKLSIKNVSTFPTMRGSSNGEFTIGPENFGHPYYMELILDDKFFSFHNLRTITGLTIVGCRNVFFISLGSFRQLVCLKRLKIRYCTICFSSDVLSAHTNEDMAATDFDVLPSLECLSIADCGITGEWLSLILQHVRTIEELHVVRCQQITGLLIEGKENCSPNLTSSPSSSSQGNPDGTSTRSCPGKLLRIPYNLTLPLKKMHIVDSGLTFQGNEEGISEFTSLEELRIAHCPKLISSLVHGDEIEDQANGRWFLPCSLGILDINDASLKTLQPCFPGDLTRLMILKVSVIFGLKSLQLHSCTALEKLEIAYCTSLDTLEDFQTLRSLACLEVYRCPGLPQCLESLSMQGYELCPRLESLCIDDGSFLTMPFCKHLTSLQCLKFGSSEQEGFFPRHIDMTGLTCEQETALQLLTSLQQLGFYNCPELSHLPVGLHRLPSLKRLEINKCPNISMLPERGLPPSLEELEVRKCSEDLTKQCRKLATIKLKVIIDRNYVN